MVPVTVSGSPAAAAPATPSWPRIRTALAAPTLGPTGSFLGYRSVAIWLPAPIGLAALVSQRQTLARWAGTTHLVAMDEHPPRVTAQATRAPEAPTGPIRGAIGRR